MQCEDLSLVLKSQYDSTNKFGINNELRPVILLLSAIVKKKVRLPGPLVKPSSMTSLQQKQRFFFTGPWRGPGPGAVAPATPPLGGPGKNPSNRNQVFQNSLFSFLLKGHLSRKEAERFLVIRLRNLQWFLVKYLYIHT